MTAMADQAVPGPDEIEAAFERVSPHTRRTPVLDVAPGTFGVDAPLTLKLELLQVTGSFKPRGAFNRMLTADVGPAGVVAASGGNFGLAVGHAARALGHIAEIFVPSSSPAAKIERVRSTGAHVHVVDGYYDDASAAARDQRDATGAVWMHPFDQIEVVAGQGTIGLELSKQATSADTVLVSVGGGGLIAGIASWFAGDVRVVGVEPETSKSMGAALAAGQPVDVPVSGIAADSLGARRVGAIAFEAARAHVDRCLTVPDDSIRDAQRAIWQELHQLAEPGGAAALAAVMTGAYRPEAGERVVVLICGSNGDLRPVLGTEG
jgi:threonine dehydratase